MENLDIVADVTFSQPMSTADEVAAEIIDLCSNTKRERAMPPVSGFLATATYLFPWLGTAARPLLDARGRRVKRELKAKQVGAMKDAES